LSKSITQETITKKIKRTKMLGKTNWLDTLKSLRFL